MLGVQDAEAHRRRGQPGRPRRGRRADARGRRRDRDRRRQGRGAADPVAERRALVHHHDRRRSRTCRSPTAASPRWPTLAPGVVSGNRRRRLAVGGGGDNNIMMDGVVDDGHRQQPAAAADERRVDRRSQGPHLELPGRVRPVERPADHRRHQERHQPVPRLGLRRRAQLRLELEQQDQHPQRRSEDGRRRADWGYSIGGPVGKPGGNNKLFFFYARSSQPRTGRQRRQSASGCRPRSSGRATSRRRTTTTAPVSLHQGSAVDRRLHGDESQPAASPTAACSAGFRRTGSTRPG